MLHKNILHIRDENGTGNVYHELNLSFDNIQVSVQDIITERVYQEVEKYNNKSVEYKHSLVQPKEDEVRLNQKKKNKSRKIDAEKQVDIALDAFRRNGFFILVDNIQVDGLDQVVTIRSETIVSFIKLTPLAGG